MNKFFLSVFTLFLFLPLEMLAQVTVEGIITDKRTGEPLPAAHVIIKGTYTGTIANADGVYNLTVPSLPATIIVRFMGFEGQEKTIDTGFSGTLDFQLEEAVLELGEITVTGEDPAISIMKEVIKRKQIWRKKLNTYQLDAYTRQQLLKDTTIVSITESISRAFWDKEKGPREVMLSKRQTANMEGSENFAGVSYLPNFYDDNLDVSGFEVMGVTNPRALSFYEFELVDFTKIDDQVVFEISVSSKKKLQPLFEGTIFVLDHDYALLSVRLKPNSVVVFPPPVTEFNLYYEQQYSNFGGEFWLPVDFRLDGIIEIGIPGLRFPPIGFTQISKLNNYQVNIALPDSLYEDDRSLFSVDSTSMAKSDSLFVNNVEVVPLSQKEEVAYTNIDSTTSLEDTFKPKGFLARFIEATAEVDDEDQRSSTSSEADTTRSGKIRKDRPALRYIKNTFSVDGRYNRVDALFAGLKYSEGLFENNLRLNLSGGYSTGYQEWSYTGKLRWYPVKSTRNFYMEAGYEAVTDTRYGSAFYSMNTLSTMPLFGYDDYFDYFRREGFFATASQYGLIRGSRLFATYRFEQHESIDFKTSYDILGANNIQRLNPGVEEGQLSSLELRLESGEGKEALGVIGADNIMLSVEHSASYIGSDWDFTRFSVDIYRRYSTFFQRRFIPNSLDLRLNAGTYLGELPVQRNGVLDAALGNFTPFGAFKSIRFLPYEGASYLAFNGEHNFRSVPLEMLGWQGAAKTGLSLIVFGGMGRTWIPQSQRDFMQTVPGGFSSMADQWHSEVGISVSNIFSLFRIDLAYRIDQPGFYPGFSFARLF